jgi:predicted Zn-dependent protease
MLQGNSEDALGTWRQLLAVAPQDADGWEGLGMASVMANRNHEAAEALEKALELDSSRTDLRVQLGYAYLKDGRDAKGVEELRKGLETVSEPPMLNNAAWVLAETKKELPLALEYAERAVAAEEAATAKTRLGSLTMEDLQHAVALGVYWDTLGLVHAQMEHLQTARKYLDASWRLTQSSLVGRNLADVAQKQGKIDEAKRLRRLATAARRGSDVLWIGPGSKPKVDAQDEADQNDVALREELASLRTIKLPALTSKTASGEFFLLVGADSKVVEAKFLSGDELLNKSTKALEGASVGGALPARQEVRIVRRGVVSCAPSSGCSIVLYTPDTVRSLE